MRSENIALLAFCAGCALTVAGNYFLIPELADHFDLNDSKFYMRTTFTNLALVCTGLIARRLAAGPKLPTGFSDDLDGKVCLVTGAAAGIGFWTALHLALRGATVVIGARTPERVSEASREIRKAAAERVGAERANNLKLVINIAPLELESFDSVRTFVKRYQASKMPLHILVNNAGIIPNSTNLWSKFHPNLEVATCVNFLSPLLLTELLAPIIKKSNGHIVHVTSSEHARLSGKFHHDNFAQTLRTMNSEKVKQNPAALAEGFMTRYRFSKLCNIYASHFFYSKWQIPNCSLHPGYVATNIFGLPQWFYENIQWLSTYIACKTLEEGAKTSLHCCLLKHAEITKKVRSFEFNVQGKMKVTAYYADCADMTDSEMSELAKDEKQCLEVIRFAKECFTEEEGKLFVM